MDQVSPYQFLFPLLSLVGSLERYWTTLIKRHAQANSAEKEVGHLGTLYNIVLKLPLNCSGWLLVFVCLGSIAILVAGALYYSRSEPPQFAASMMKNSYWTIVAAAFVFFLVTFNALPRAALYISRRFNYYHFKPGWINARRQIAPDPNHHAINISRENCERFAWSVFGCIRNEKAPQLPMQAPQPEGLQPDELANYLLFRGALETLIPTVYGDSPQKLEDMSKFLSWAARRPERPFKASEVVEHAKRQRSFCQTLQDLANQAEEPPDEMGTWESPTAISTSFFKIVESLAKRYKGDGSQIAKNWLTQRPSAITLLNRLKVFDRYDRREANRRLFLKLSVRMNVWPGMSPGPFMYPYNSGIAALFLNSGCIRVSDGVNVIVADEEFRGLVAFVEESIIEECYATLSRTVGDRTTIEFCKVVFDCEPTDVDKWQFTDYVDLWLFGHTKRFCRLRTAGSALPSTCPLASNDDTCYCNAVEALWRVQVDSLVRH